MPPIFRRLTSVTRWLIVVVFGCAILEMAQPMTAAPAASDSRGDDTVLYPKNSTERPAADADTREGGNSWMLAVALLLAMGGVWLVVKRRGLPLSFPKPARSRRLLAVEETKSLGGRQYLVVASCEGRRFLLGVTPGHIEMLSPLDDADDIATPADSAAES